MVSRHLESNQGHLILSFQDRYSTTTNSFTTAWAALKRCGVRPGLGARTQRRPEGRRLAFYQRESSNQVETPLPTIVNVMRRYAKKDNVRKSTVIILN